MFVGSTVPASSVAQQNYFRLHRVLQARGVALTMAHLASHWEKYPGLAEKAQRYRFDMVITLGAPIAFLELPADIKLRHYYSPQDKVVRLASCYGPTFLYAVGFPIGISPFPPRLNPADRIRVFASVEHPNWDIDRRVVDRIVRETNLDFRPLWHSPVLAPGLGNALVRMVHMGLETHTQITLEDPPTQWIQMADPAQ